MIKATLIITVLFIAGTAVSFLLLYGIGMFISFSDPRDWPDLAHEVLRMLSLLGGGMAVAGYSIQKSDEWS